MKGAAGSPGELPDPYTELGLPRGASDEEIKRAYRKKASETHPDKRPGEGASSAPFQSVQRAYALLANPRRRAEYDRTGRDPGAAPKVDEERLTALRRLAGVFLGAVDALEPDAQDVIAAVHGALDAMGQEASKQMSALRTQVRKYERAKKRLRVASGKPNALGDMLDAQIRSINEALDRGRAELECLQLMRGILGDYGWEFEADMPLYDHEITFRYL